MEKPAAAQPGHHEPSSGANDGVAVSNSSDNQPGANSKAFNSFEASNIGSRDNTKMISQSDESSKASNSQNDGSKPLSSRNDGLSKASSSQLIDNPSKPSGSQSIDNLSKPSSSQNDGSNASNSQNDPSKPSSSQNDGSKASNSQNDGLSKPSNSQADSKPSSTQSTTKSDGKFDLGAIRNILEHDSSQYLEGMRNTDVDWFLRDSNISPDVSQPPKQPPQETKLAKKSSNGSLSPVSSHLTTPISNTNDHNLAKTKPSISPIQEEFSPRVDNSHNHTSNTNTSNSFSNLRRRSSVSSINSTNSASSVASTNSASGVGGFFNKLKGKLHIKSGPDAPSSPSSSPLNSPPLRPTTAPMDPPQSNHQGIPSRQRATSQPSLFKENYDLKLKKTTSEIKTTPRRRGGDDLKLTRTTSTPNYINTNSNLDPKINEYIRFYQQRNPVLSPSSSRRSSTPSIHTPLKKQDTNAIPNHPNKSPLPSALKNPLENTTYTKDPEVKPRNNSVSAEASTTSRISSFLRRRSNTASISTINSPADKHRQSFESASSQASPSQLSLDSSTSEEIPPEFAGLKPLKRVAFHSSTFLIDPPQQIPSRTPRKGNVEVDSNGNVKVNPLTEEDKLAIERSQLGKGGGLVVGGTGSLGLIKKPQEPNQDDDTNFKGDGDSAHQEAVSPPRVKSEEDDQDEKIDKHAKLIAIDKPMIHQSHSRGYSVPLKKMALDLMYTRCCHLREILPIPAILKQIPKGSMAPLPILQLRNPTPTLVEVQTFADFLRIAPILCVSLDGVSLSLEQFKILLSAMSAKKQMEKLSLRNTPIDHQGWSLLCWFLSRNTVLNKLDITQCPSLSVNLLKKKKRKQDDKKEDVQRMSCNRENRSDMDWALFTATIIARGGIEELILTGCCITDLDIFDKFVSHALSIKTHRLGLAYNQLSAQQLKVINTRWLYLDFVRGVDLGYNDFSSTKYLKVLLEMYNDKSFQTKLSQSSLAFLSLNATNIRFSDMFQEVFEKILMKFPRLRYLDLSNNPRLFGSVTSSRIPNIKLEPSSVSMDSEASSGENMMNGTSRQSKSSPPVSKLSQEAIISYFSSNFPLFPKLIRLHLENNNLSINSIVTLAKILPFCKNLAYFSVIGNEMDLTAGAALIQALMNSKTLVTLDCDYENFPDLFKERIGLYTMKNMERLLYLSGDGPKNAKYFEEEDSTTSLTVQLNNILSKKAENKLDLKDPDVVKFIDKARAIRRELKETMNELFKLQWHNELNLEGKETLIRFLFIDSSIEKGLQLIDNSLLANEDEPQSSSKMFMIGGAEDEKNKYREDDDRTNVDELRNDNLAVSDSNQVPQSSSPLALSRSESKTSLTNLNRQEGSVLKLSKLHDFHESGFFDKLDVLSGEEIREQLKSVDFADLDKIISVLESLKAKGISLREYYTNQQNNTQAESRQLLDLSELKTKIANITRWSDGKGDMTKDNKSETDERPLSSSDTDDDGSIEGSASQDDVIREAYDKVLHDRFEADN